jgi:hypothetical protein
MLTESQAIEIAKKEFAEQGHAASDYDIKVDTYYADHGQWIVWFDKKGPFRIPGGKQAVRVHKETGCSVFMPGE